MYALANSEYTLTTKMSKITKWMHRCEKQDT